jgi:hypothetical protein
LSEVVDWRWGLRDETTPWYSTMRLFRQSRLDDWQGVMQRVAGALKDRKWPARETRNFKTKTGGVVAALETKELA